MKPYIRVWTNAVTAKLSYKSAVSVGWLTQLAQMAASVFVWRAIIPAQAAVNGYTQERITSYLIITALMQNLFAPTHMFRLSDLVRKGTLNALLVRPYNLLGDSLAAFLAQRMIDTVSLSVLGTIGLMIGVLRLGPVSALGASVLFSNLVLLFMFTETLGCLSFWLIHMWPLRSLFLSIGALFGGGLFPLSFLPHPFFAAVRYNPFALFGYANTVIVQGRMPNVESIHYLYASLTWIGVLLALRQILWIRGLRTYEAVSG